jgi:hypothetical protein
VVAIKGNGASAPLPPLLSFDEIRSSRIDYRDVVVPELGGRELRIYALSGSARAALMSEMVSLAGIDLENAKNPEVIGKVMLYSGRVVAASLGYPQDQWDVAADALGSGAVETLYEVAAELSKLTDDATEKDVARLQRRRKAASGTGSHSR